MAAVNIATWTKSKQDGWQLVVQFNRGWEAPKEGDGLGAVVTAVILKKNERLSKESKASKLRLTSRVFRNKGQLKAFAEQA